MMNGIRHACNATIFFSPQAVTFYSESANANCRFEAETIDQQTWHDDTSDEMVILLMRLLRCT